MTNSVIIEQDFIVTNPTINRKYHISWASRKGMVWILLGFNDERAYLMTPKTKKSISCRLNELREINYYAQINASKREKNTSNK